MLAPYGERYQKKIRVFAAAASLMERHRPHAAAGADGVQMATRFIATYECDAADSFKQAVLQCTKEDIRLIKSPAACRAGHSTPALSGA
ncbi:MAG: nitronate monooxygenase [Merdibacter sp.]